MDIHEFRIPEEPSMTRKDGMKMKKGLLMFLCLLLACGASFAEDAVSSATLSVDRLPEIEATDSSVLVVYFSTDDTIRAAAYTVADTLSANLFEIQPAEPYTEDDVNYHNSRSRTSIEQNDPQARPAIASLPEDLDRYDTVILGYPIWWGEAPRILCTFVESVDLSAQEAARKSCRSLRAKARSGWMPPGSATAAPQRKSGPGRKAWDCQINNVFPGNS